LAVIVVFGDAVTRCILHVLIIVQVDDL